MTTSTQPKLLVNVDAVLVWADPPANPEEQQIREATDAMLSAAAAKLNTIAQLMLVEILEARMASAPKKEEK